MDKSHGNFVSQQRLLDAGGDEAADAGGGGALATEALCRAGRLGQGDDDLQVNETGKIVQEARIPTEPEAIVELLKAAGLGYARIGLRQGRCRNGWWPAYSRRGCR